MNFHLMSMNKVENYSKFLHRSTRLFTPQHVHSISMQTKSLLLLRIEGETKKKLSTWMKATEKKQNTHSADKPQSVKHLIDNRNLNSTQSCDSSSNESEFCVWILQKSIAYTRCGTSGDNSWISLFTTHNIYAIIKTDTRSSFSHRKEKNATY